MKMHQQIPVLNAPLLARNAVVLILNVLLASQPIFFNQIRRLVSGHVQMDILKTQLQIIVTSVRLFASKCTGATASLCSACNTGYYLQPSPNHTVCNNTCPSGYFEASSNNTCVKCTAPCTECSAASTQCTACAATYYLQPTTPTCLQTCPNGSFKNLSTLNCDNCTTACSKCGDSTATNCSSCSTGYYLQPSPDDTTCNNSCPSGFYGDASTNTCIQCTTACTKCSDGTATQCSACNATYYLQPAPHPTTCTNTCPSGYYEVSSSNTCGQCTSPCSDCNSSATQCSSCVATYYLQPNGGTTCLQSCPAGYYEDSSTTLCGQCTSPCSNCSGSATHCSTCVATYYLQPSSPTCLQTCPNGYLWRFFYQYLCSLHCSLLGLQWDCDQLFCLCYKSLSPAWQQRLSCDLPRWLLSR